MSPDTVAIVMIVLLCLLIFFALLGALAGFIKGLYKTTVKTILLAVLLVVFVFVTPSIANAVGNIDLSNFNLSFAMGEQTIAVTTIQETLANIITATGLISPMNGISIYETAIALATSLLSYVLFFVLVLLTQIFISLFTAIIYNGIFRWFLPVETAKQRKARKNRKKEERALTDGIYFEEDDDEKGDDLVEEIDPDMEPGMAYSEDFSDEKGFEKTEVSTKKRWPLLRLPGAALGACAEFVLAMSLFAPFTALARTAVQHRDTLQIILEQLFPDQAEDIASYIDVIDNSAFYQLMGVGGFDTSLMNRTSKVTIGGQEVSFNQILASSLDIAKPLLESDSITFGSGSFNITVNYGRLLDSAMVHTMIEGVLDNPVITSLIPPLIDIGIHSLSSALPISDLDFSNIDWTDELSTIDSAYESLYQTGLVSTMFSADGTKLTPENFSIPVNEWSDSEYNENLNAYTKALEALGDLEVFQKNLPIVLSSLSWTLYSSGYDVFPTDVEAYADVDWGHDLALLGKSTLSLCRDLGISLSAKTDFSKLGDQIVDKMKSEKTQQSLRKTLLGTDGATSIMDQGLLDMDLFDVLSLPDILYSSLNSVSALRPYLAEVDFKQFENLGKAGLKKEFSLLFDMAEILFAEDSPIHIEDGLDGIDFTDPLVSETFVDILDVGEASRVFNALYPTLIRTFLFDTGVEIEDYLYGLTPYDFNFDAKDFTTNFKKLVEIMPELYDLYKIVTDDTLSTKEQLTRIDANTIGKLLEIVASSDFFNPAQSSGIQPTSAKGRNFNVYVVLKNVLSKQMFQDIGFVVPSEETISDIVWSSAEGSGEIDNLVSLIRSAQQNVDFLLDMENADIQDPDSLSQMIKTGFDSKILEPSILSVINKSMQTFLEDLGIHKTINEMRTELWKEDCDDIVTLLTLIKKIDLKGDDFFDTLDPNVINALLTTLYRTNFLANSFGAPLVTGEESFVNEQRDRNFSEYLTALLKSQGLMDKAGIPNFNYSLLYCTGYSRSTEEVLIVDRNYSITKEGEIRGLADFLQRLKEVGIGSLSGGKIPEGFLTSFTAETRSSRMVKAILSIAVDNAMSNLEIEEDYRDALSSLDSSVLLNLNADEVQAEMALFDHLIRLSTADETGTTPLMNMLENIVMMDDDSLTEFQKLLSEMGQSHLMTTPTQGTFRSPISELLKAVFSNNNLNNAPLIEQVTLAPDETKYDSYYDGLLSSITSWPTEMETLSQFLEKAKDLGITADTPFNTIFQNPDNEERAIELMKILNRSKLFHRVPIYTFQNNIDDPDLEDNLASLFVNPSDPSDKGRIDYFAHAMTNEEDFLYWDNEIEHGIRLLFGVSQYMIHGFRDADFSVNGIDLSILYELGCMDLFRDVRSNLIYNLVAHTAPDQVSPATVATLFLDRVVAGTSPKSARLERLFFQNPELLNEEGRMDEKRTLADISAVQKVLGLILQNLDVALDGDLASIAQVFSFEKLTDNCFYTYEGDMKRSLLASELVAGLIKVVFCENSIWEQIPGGLPLEIDDELLYGDLTIGYDQGLQYPLVNPVEGRALDGIIQMVLITQDDSAMPLKKQTMADLLHSFSIDKEDSSEIYLSFANSEAYADSFNAQIVSNDGVVTLLSLFVVKEDDGSLVMMSSLMKDFSYETSTYESILA